MFTLNMPDIFNKTEHDLTDILIARAEFKSVLNPEFFFRHNTPYVYCVLDWNSRLRTLFRGSPNFFFRTQSIQISLKFTSQPSLWSLYKPCSKRFGLNIWVPVPIQRHEYTSGYDTVRYNNLATMILVQWLSQIILNTHTGWEISGWSSSNWNGVTVQLNIFCPYLTQILQRKI